MNDCKHPNVDTVHVVHQLLNGDGCGICDARKKLLETGWPANDVPMYIKRVVIACRDCPHQVLADQTVAESLQ